MARDVLQVGLRIPKSLRDRLQRTADANGFSLNQEIAVRLDRSLRDEEVGAAVFRNRQRFELLEAFDRILRITELRLGKEASLDNPRVLERAAAAWLTLIGAAPAAMQGRILAGKVVKFESLRDFIDWQTASLLDHFLENERRRQAGKTAAAPDTAEPEEQEEEPAGPDEDVAAAPAPKPGEAA